MHLTHDQERRYIRQMMLAEIGREGQEKIAAARVLVVGAGGLGSALIPYLAAAGVGVLGIIDSDRVELSNLARQVMYETGDLGRLKVEAARDRVSELNPEILINSYPEALTAENAVRVMKDYDIIADGCDNFATRFLVNKTCVALKKPLISGAVAGWEGQVASFNPAHIPASPCYQCFLHPEAPEANTCIESGVAGPLVGMIGAAQALEVLRMILGSPALIGKLALTNGRTHQQRMITIHKDVTCEVCGAAA